MKCRNIHEAFESLMLKDLERLRHATPYPIGSGLRKAKLVEALEDNFRKDPAALLRLLPLCELQLLSDLCSTSPEHSIECWYYPYAFYIEEFHICNHTMSTRNQMMQEFSLSDEMRDLLTSHVEPVMKEIIDSGRDIVDHLFFGMMCVYGCISHEQLIQMLMKWLGRDEWMEMMSRMRSLFPYVDSRNEYGAMKVNPMIGDIDRLLAVRHTKGFDKKPLKEYTFDQIVKIGATAPHFVYGEGEETYNAVVAVLKECGYDADQARNRLSTMWFLVQNTEGWTKPTDIIKFVIGSFSCLPTMEKLNDFCVAISNYMNSLPRWEFGGRAPKELFIGREQQSNMVALQSSMKINAENGIYPKVGRNDPCPCGSGLKYKKCHGKNIN